MGEEDDHEKFAETSVLRLRVWNEDSKGYRDKP
jgi:hypothetical protein